MKHRKFWAILLSAMLALQLCLLPAAATEELTDVDSLGMPAWLNLSTEEEGTETTPEGTTPEQPSESTPWTDLTEATPVPRDISAWVKVTPTLTINGIEYTEETISGVVIPVEYGTTFTYRFDWNLRNAPIGQSLMAGDTFTVELMAAKKMNIVPLIARELVMDKTTGDAGDLNKDPHVGEWDLTYDAETGKMLLKVTFNANASSYNANEIVGYVENGGSFKVGENEDGTEDVTIGTATGTFDFVPKESGGSNPGGGETPVVGTPWNPPTPAPSESKNYPFGKGGHIKRDGNDPDPAIQWRLVYMQKLQGVLANYYAAWEKADDSQKTDGTWSYDLSTEMISQNCIIEDILDEYQVFRYENFIDSNSAHNYENGAPFFFGIPLMVPGSNEILNGYPGDGNYNGGGEMYTYISAKGFTHISTEGLTLEAARGKVEEQPRSWTVVNGNHLIVNAGYLGTTDAGQGMVASEMELVQTGVAAWRDNGWEKQLQNELTSKIDEYQNKINAAKAFTDSPLYLLDTRVAELKTEVNGLVLDVTASNDVAAYFTAYEEWRTNRSDGYRHQMTDADANIYQITNNDEPSAYAKLKAVLGNSTLAETQVYKNFLVSVENLAGNQEKYDEKYDSNIDSWEKAIDQYKAAKYFYEHIYKGQIYGFVMEYATEVTNPYTTSVSNTATINLAGTDPVKNSWNNLKFNYKSGISGSFRSGTIVIQKADSGYTQIADAEKDLNPLTGATFQLFRKADNSLVYFSGKTEDTYGNLVYTYDPTGSVTDLKLNADGKLLLYKVPSGDYYLKEVSAPKGYYLNDTHIEVNSDINSVIVKMVKNTARGVELTKMGSDNKLLEGVTFKLHKKDGTELTGFQVRTIGTETFYWYTGNPEDAGVLLKTDAKGMLKIHGLDAGEYYLVETETIEGYQRPNPVPYLHFVLGEKLPESAGDGIYRVKAGTNNGIVVNEVAEPPKEPETGEPPFPIYPIDPPEPPKPKPDPEEPEVEEPEPEPEPEPEEPEPEEPETETPETETPVDPTDPEFDLNDPNSPTGSMEGENPSDPEFDLNDPNAPTGSMEGEWGKLPQTGWRQTAVAAAALGGVALLAGGLLLHIRRRRRQ